MRGNHSFIFFVVVFCCCFVLLFEQKFIILRNFFSHFLFFSHRYGKILIATGNSPVVDFKVTDAAVPQVSTYKTIQDFEVFLFFL